MIMKRDFFSSLRSCFITLYNLFVKVLSHTHPTVQYVTLQPPVVLKKLVQIINLSNKPLSYIGILHKHTSLIIFLDL